MKFIVLMFFLLSLQFSCLMAQTRTELLLTKNWKFAKGDFPDAIKVDFDDKTWETVNIPHDWAINGPFDKEIDIQRVAIIQNGEEVPTEKTGRTGALPYIGVGWYRLNFSVPDFVEGKRVTLLFDGAMSEPKIYLNGKFVGEWAYGYNSFYFDITPFLNPEGENILAVRLEIHPELSRWYPGAGLYRNVHLIVTNQTAIDVWGTYVTTPVVSDEFAKIEVQINVLNSKDKNLNILHQIKDAEGNVVASELQENVKFYDNENKTELVVEKPKLWSPESPDLYFLNTTISDKNIILDEYVTQFGIRSVAFESGKGFLLNGKIRKFKGVCLHHDLGPLGAAVNKSAIRRQLLILKEMGCDAIRSSHNMPSPEQVELCDELGLMFMAESFDEWAKPKCKNGYNRFFEKWAEKDVVNLVCHYRNNPSVVMWSSGNEVPDQWGEDGVKRALWLQNIFHREDPSRMVTIGMDQVKSVMENGFGSIMDIPGLNYRTHLYEEAYQHFPQGFVLGSETASTVSSRGIYHFPVEYNKNKMYENIQCSSYDFDCCSWSNLPDDDFVLQDDKPWVIGEFVWTGFDYLGEPTPYDEIWPSRSSYFGICDLAGLPKDRYYLYQSRWNQNKETLHILPHWNWEGKEGENIPVFVYTNYESAELFVNGKSQGIKTKSITDNKQERYRLMWMDVKYEPGTLKVVAYKDGKVVAENELHTAGKPHHLELVSDSKTILADGQDIAFVTVRVVDKDGNLCPNANNQLLFKVSGKGKYRAACNGDATSLEIFHLPTMKAFSGQLVVLIQSTEEAGNIKLTVSGKGLKSNSLEIIANPF